LYIRVIAKTLGQAALAERTRGSARSNLRTRKALRQAAHAPLESTAPFAG
jgi:hypothetical protein